jgi:uncharacterized protein YuzE
MWSNRFQKNIWLTHHAKYAMEKRDIPEAVVCDLIETGEIKHGDSLMKIIYYEDDDILFIEFNKDKIVHDESLNWNVNIGYTKDGIGEITILEAKEKGYYPFEFEKIMRHAA